jgi:hypothetical protein
MSSAAFWAIATVVWVVACGAIYVTGAVRAMQLERGAIERGYALHCPQDGRWAWVGECRE